MNKQTEALKLALEALERHAELGLLAGATITAIREALAEPPCKTGSQCTSKCEQCEQPAQQIVEEYDPNSRTISVYPSEWKAQQQEPVAHVLFRQDEDGLEPVMFYGPGTAPDPTTLKARFTLRDVWLSPPAQQEPVYFCDYGYEGWEKVDAAMAAENLACGMTVEVYYTSPPASKPWVGLTAEDKVNIEKIVGITEDDDGWMVSQMFTLTEAKLREKNA